MILSAQIAAMRKKAGEVQEELADKLGASRQTVSKLEIAESVQDLIQYKLPVSWRRT